MPDFAWGLQMMAVGMGVVFLLLAVLMGLLIVIGRLDARASAAAEAAAEAAKVPAAPAPEPVGLAASDTDAVAPAAPKARIVADGLDENQVAAITVAVMTHAEIRRRSAAPEARAFEPGSQLFASRWVSIGRGNQQIPFRRR